MYYQIPDFPTRKQLRLKGYDYTLPNDFFVTICTYNRQHIFGEVKDGKLIPAQNQPHKMVEEYLKCLEKKFDGVKISAHTIMPDHIHFILEKTEPDGDFREIIKWFKTQTTNAYIREVKRGNFLPFSKRLWQRDYYEHIMDDDFQNEYAGYIELNPHRLTSDEKWRILLSKG